MPDSPLRPDTVIYANCVADARNRLAVIERELAAVRARGKESNASIELIFLQFRKALEQIAFASLSANKEIYSRVHANFRSHWKAKAMLDAIAKLNPDFYPVALEAPLLMRPGSWLFPSPATREVLRDAITRAEFEQLYDVASDLMHIQNPFAATSGPKDIGYSVDEWVRRIRLLLTWHTIVLVDGSRWMVAVPARGDVRLFTARPIDDGQNTEIEGMVVPNTGQSDTREAPPWDTAP